MFSDDFDALATTFGPLKHVTIYFKQTCALYKIWVLLKSWLKQYIITVLPIGVHNCVWYLLPISQLVVNNSTSILFHASYSIMRCCFRIVPRVSDISELFCHRASPRCTSFPLRIPIQSMSCAWFCRFCFGASKTFKWINCAPNSKSATRLKAKIQ